MKSISQIIIAFSIATVFATGGYLLGKKQSTVSASSNKNETSANFREKLPLSSRRTLSSAFDVGELREKLEREKNPLVRFKLVLENLEDWINKNPEDALNWLASQPPTLRRNEVMRMALAQFAQIDAKGAAAWAAGNLTGVDLNNALISIASAWARQNGKQAATWFMEQAATPERDAAMETILFNWASNDSAAALKYLTENSNIGELSPTLRKAALAGWAKSEPAAAVAVSYELSKTNQDPAQFANTLANWATVDLDASSAWLLTNLPAGKERTAAADELGTIFGQQSPEAGIAWLGKLNAGPERDAAANSLLQEWSRMDPEASAKWAAKQNSANLSEASVARMNRNFMMKNQPMFEAWRTALPAGPLKNQANNTQPLQSAEEE